MSDISSDQLIISPELATAIIVEAKNYNVYNGALPEDEGKRVSVATEIAQTALDFWQEDNARGSEVTAILGLAGVQDAQGNGELTVQAENEKVELKVQGVDVVWTWEDLYDYVVVRANEDIEVSEDIAKRLNEAIDEYDARQTTEDKDYETTDDEPEGVGQAEPDDSGESDDASDDSSDTDMEEPWAGYDSLTLAEIKTEINKIPDLTYEEREYIVNYEREHKHRKGVINFLESETETTEAHDELDAEADAAIAADEREAEIPAVETEDDVPADPVGEVSESDIHDGEHRHLAGVEENSVNARALAEAKVSKERLPVPRTPEFDDDPVLPRDISVLSDEALNQLYIDFNACLVRATWLGSLARIDHRTYKRIADREEGQAYLRARGIDPETKKAKTVPVIEAEAENDEHLVKWRELEGSAKDEYEAMEALRDSYQASVDALSRLGGFRQEEFKRSSR